MLNTNSRAKGGTVGLSLAGEPGFAGLSINYLANNYGIPPDRGATPSDWTRIDLRQTRYDFKGALNEPFTFADSLHLHVVYNDYQHVELENGEAGTAYKNKDVETRLELVQKPWAIFHHGILGMQTKNSKFTTIGEEAVVPESDINAFGFYTLQDIYSGPLTFEMGMRVEQQFIDPTGFQRSSHTPVSASASVLWNITGQDRSVCHLPVRNVLRMFRNYLPMALIWQPIPSTWAIHGWRKKHPVIWNWVCTWTAAGCRWTSTFIRTG